MARFHFAKRLPAVAIAAWLVALTIAPREAPATVEEQRARLPPPAECSSPVTGRWKSLNFDERQMTWYQFTLEIHEDPRDPTALTGMIYVDAWDGTGETAEPPVPCVRRHKGEMTARGSFKDGWVAFGGIDYHQTEQVCGDSVGYNPDQFTGSLDAARQEFQAVNNDGGAEVNTPTVFRRIGCFDDGRKDPGSAVAPPPFFPKKQGGGCL
ncbi:MAG TPA: hypothetical protein VGF94_30595 [Kofleriaceae bacterium]|jgi:hypothetical protein